MLPSRGSALSLHSSIQSARSRRSRVLVCTSTGSLVDEVHTAPFVLVSARVLANGVTHRSVGGARVLHRPGRGPADAVSVSVTPDVPLRNGPMPVTGPRLPRRIATASSCSSDRPRASPTRPYQQPARGRRALSLGRKCGRDAAAPGAQVLARREQARPISDCCSRREAALSRKRSRTPVIVPSGSGLEVARTYRCVGSSRLPVARTQARRPGRGPARGDRRGVRVVHRDRVITAVSRRALPPDDDFKAAPETVRDAPIGVACLLLLHGRAGIRVHRGLRGW